MITKYAASSYHLNESACNGGDEFASSSHHCHDSAHNGGDAQMITKYAASSFVRWLTMVLILDCLDYQVYDKLSPFYLHCFLKVVFCLFLLLQLTFNYDALLHFIIVVVAKVVFELPDILYLYTSIFHHLFFGLRLLDLDMSVFY